MERNICAETHSGFVALRQHCMMNIDPDLSHAGAIVWRNQPMVSRDVARIKAAWATCLAQSVEPFLAGNFSALDAYLASLVMRLKYYRFPGAAASQVYMDRLCDHAAVTD